MSRVEGLRSLNRKLGELDAKVGIKTLTRASSKALNPTTRKIRAKAPVGKRDHKTYRGRTVFPGFLKRSVRQRSRRNRRNGSIEVRIGVLKEAFYGVQFLDKGISVSTRRASGRRRSNITKVDISGRGRRFNRRAFKIEPYDIQGKRWFEQTFRTDRFRIQRDLSQRLAAEIDKVRRAP